MCVYEKGDERYTRSTFGYWIRKETRWAIDRQILLLHIHYSQNILLNPTVTIPNFSRQSAQQFFPTDKHSPHIVIRTPETVLTETSKYPRAKQHKTNVCSSSIEITKTVAFQTIKIVQYHGPNVCEAEKKPSCQRNWEQTSTTLNRKGNTTHHRKINLWYEFRIFVSPCVLSDFSIQASQVSFHRIRGQASLGAVFDFPL